MEKITIWHNPKCSKSREAMKILEENEVEKEVVEYLKTIPTEDEIKNILKLLSLDARKLMRTKENVYKELNLADENDEIKLIEAMAKNPILIERPVIIRKNKAIIGRPTSCIVDFIG